VHLITCCGPKSAALVALVHWLHGIPLWRACIWCYSTTTKPCEEHKECVLRVVPIDLITCRGPKSAALVALGHWLHGIPLWRACIWCYSTTTNPCEEHKECVLRVVPIESQTIQNKQPNFHCDGENIANMIGRHLKFGRWALPSVKTKPLTPFLCFWFEFMIIKS
jgi:hypothetical protein